MADDFEARFYALLEEFEYGGEAHVEAFKAKGDDAQIFGNLSDDSDDYGFARSLVKLMADFGVTGAPDLRERNIGIFGPKPTYRMRDMRLATLKAAIDRGRWPDDAWILMPVTASNWGDWLYSLYIVVGGMCLFAIWAPGKLLLLFVRDPIIRSVIVKILDVSGLIFMVLAISRIVLLLICLGWRMIARGWRLLWSR